MQLRCYLHEFKFKDDNLFHKFVTGWSRGIIAIKQYHKLLDRILPARMAKVDNFRIRPNSRNEVKPITLMLRTKVASQIFGIAKNFLNRIRLA